MATQTKKPKKKTAGQSKPEEHCRIRYADGETGWAIKLPDGKYRINNVPLADDLNIDDIVECTPGDEFNLPKVIKIVKPAFKYKDGIYYQTVTQFHDFCKEARKVGAKVEGCVAPYTRNGKHNDGILMVSHNDDFDPHAVATKLGIKNGGHKSRAKKK